MANIFTDYRMQRLDRCNRETQEYRNRCVDRFNPSTQSNYSTGNWRLDYYNQQTYYQNNG